MIKFYLAKPKESGYSPNTIAINASDYIIKWTSSFMKNIISIPDGNNQLKQKELQAGSTQVFDFISRYGKVAVMEVACVYDITFEDAQKLLKQMTKKGLISEKKVGNGAFYSLPQDTLQCDSATGSCAF